VHWPIYWLSLLGFMPQVLFVRQAPCVRCLGSLAAEVEPPCIGGSGFSLVSGAVLLLSGGPLIVWFLCGLFVWGLLQPDFSQVGSWGFLKYLWAFMGFYLYVLIAWGCWVALLFLACWCSGIAGGFFLFFYNPFKAHLVGFFI
jgi:hypothetical protein